MQDDLLNQMRNFMQNFHDGPPGEDKETEATTDTELTSTEDIQPLPVQEPPQNSDICQLIRKECCVEVREEQEVKNVVEQSAERGSRSIQTLKNFKVVYKSSISSNTSQICSINSISHILSTKEPKNLLNMGYEHLSITPKMESDEVTESNTENLLQIPSKCEVALKDKKECDLPIFENSPVYDKSDTFSDSKIDDDISVYDDNFEDIEYVEASLSDPENVSTEGKNGVEEENVVQQEEEESDNSLLDNFSPEFKTFCDHSEETRSGSTTHANYSLPEYDSFCFEIEPDHERLINLMKNDIFDLSNDPFLEEVDLFLSNDSTPPVIKNIADNPEGDILFLEELVIDDSILSHESFVSNFEDNPSIPRPSPNPPDAETDAGEEIPVVMIDKDKFDDDS
nr:hypothetical protein [Tanacetum cinerariifolium]